eukprot:9750-Rhodomonas_salina.2
MQSYHAFCNQGNECYQHDPLNSRDLSNVLSHRPFGHEPRRCVLISSSQVKRNLLAEQQPGVSGGTGGT